jgi:heme A synthase
VGLLLQAPIGWWTLRAVGTERFLMVWGLGMLVRFAVVAVAAFVLMPAPEPLAAPMLATMVGALVALLLVEGTVAMREHSREDEQ